MALGVQGIAEPALVKALKVSRSLKLDDVPLSVDPLFLVQNFVNFFEIQAVIISAVKEKPPKQMLQVVVVQTNPLLA